MENKKIINYIHKELSKFNFKKQTKGFKYLCDTIYICIQDEDSLNNLSQYVFPKIAMKYNEKSPYNVKWCIDQIIKTMYNNTEIKIICDYFNVDENIKPSLKFIVYTLVCNYKNKR